MEAILDEFVGVFVLVGAVLAVLIVAAAYATLFGAASIGLISEWREQKWRFAIRHMLWFMSGVSLFLGFTYWVVH
jgi:hypothetical protein